MENININDIKTSNQDISTKIKLTNPLSINAFNNSTSNIEKKDNDNKTPIKEFDLTKKLDEKDYVYILKNSPSKFFENITAQKFYDWNIKLKKENIKNKNYSQPIRQKSYSFNTINTVKYTDIYKEGLEIYNNKLSPSLKKQIYNDVKRTRVREKILVELYEEKLHSLISFYIFKQNIKYKQGLNEIFGIFLLLKYKISNVSYTDIYNLIDNIITKYFYNYFHDDGVAPINSSLSLLLLLIKYHLPTIFNTFDCANINSLMLPSNWILTLNIGKLNLHICFALLEHLININDNLFPFYFTIAIFKYYSDIILKAEFSEILLTIGKLTVESIEELDKLVNIALEIRNSTPYSFRIFSNYLEIFNNGSPNIKAKFDYYRPDLLTTLPIFPCEIFYKAYTGSIPCPNELCKYYSNNAKSKYCYECEHCDMGINKDINFIILDLRFDNENDINGFLRMTVKIDDTLNKIELDDFLNERFREEKGKYHFIFLNSNPKNFSYLEDTFFKENDINQSYFYFDIKRIKDVDEQKVDNLSSEEKLLFNEYKFTRNIVENLLKGDFPYISFAYDGYFNIHEQSFLYDIELINHDRKLCKYCNEMVKKGMLSKKSRNFKMEKILWNNFDNNKNMLHNVLSEQIDMQDICLFVQNKNDTFLIVCNLIEYKNSKVNDKLVLLFNKIEIILYKFDKSKSNNKEYIKEGLFEKNSHLTRLIYINIKNIKGVEFYSDKDCESGASINYIENNNKNSFKSLIIQFLTQKDFKYFINFLKSIPK